MKPTHQPLSREHIRVRLMRHLLNTGLKAITDSVQISVCATPRLQAYLAKERLWVIDLSCGSSQTPHTCRRYICGRAGSTCFAIPIPPPNEMDELDDRQR